MSSTCKFSHKVANNDHKTVPGSQLYSTKWQSFFFLRGLSQPCRASWGLILFGDGEWSTLPNSWSHIENLTKGLASLSLCEGAAWDPFCFMLYNNHNTKWMSWSNSFPLLLYMPQNVVERSVVTTNHSSLRLCKPWLILNQVQHPKSLALFSKLFQKKNTSLFFT